MNMKNLFSDKKGSGKGFAELFNRKGFYIILILAIIVVGATAIIITRTDLKFLNFLANTEDNYEDNYIPGDFENYLIDDDGYIDTDYAIEEGELIGESGTGDANGETGADTSESSGKELEEAKVENTVSGDKLATTQDLAAQDTKNKTEKENTKTENSTDAVTVALEETTAAGELKVAESSTFIDEEEIIQVSVPVTTEEKPDFIMPVYGNIISDFAMDKLAYSKTLEDWRVHSGIDIAAARGTAVKAVADGVVCDSYYDPKMGNTIVIDHGNGFKTVYSNLASLDIVLPNEIVHQGDTVGAVGDTALFEVAQEPHLHFEVIKDDKVVNPKLYLPDY